MNRIASIKKRGATPLFLRMPFLFLRKLMAAFAAVIRTLRIFLTAVLANLLCAHGNQLLIHGVELFIQIVDCRNAFIY